MMDSVSFFGSPASGQEALSRRGAVLGLSGGLTALLVHEIIPAAAQEGSPSAGTPAAGRANLAIHQYQLAPDRTTEEPTAAVAGGAGR